MIPAPVKPATTPTKKLAGSLSIGPSFTPKSRAFQTRFSGNASARRVSKTGEVYTVKTLARRRADHAMAHIGIQEAVDGKIVERMATNLAACVKFSEV
jgi:hypothetical protein